MSIHSSDSVPTTARLLKATAAAVITAGAILVMAVLPAEYGIDPTGVGSRLGLLALSGRAPPSLGSAKGAAHQAGPAQADVEMAALAESAATVFGVQAGQSFDAHAVTRHAGPVRTDTMAVTLAPGKGAEIKTAMLTGESFLFRWTASAEVAVDMHGERPEVKDQYTSYWIEAAQREGGGRFTAPFDGHHGWYWLNRGKQPVTVQLSVTGSQKKLFRPGHE